MSSPVSAPPVTSSAVPDISPDSTLAATPPASYSAETAAVPVQPPIQAADRPRNRIQVSREKRPLNFFVGLAKKFLVNEDEVVLSGLGLAVTTVVTVVEILRAAGQVGITRVETSLVDSVGDGRGSGPKAKIQIWVHRGPQFGQPGTARDAAGKSAVSSSSGAPATANGLETIAETPASSSASPAVTTVQDAAASASTSSSPSLPGGSA